MERVMYKILIEQKRLDIPRGLSKEEIQRILNKGNVKEIMKFAVDNKYTKCRIATDSKAEIDFFCYFDLNQMVTLGSPLYNYGNVRISIDDADIKYFTTKELKELGYKPTSIKTRFSKDIVSDYLQGELFKYGKELEKRIENELKHPSISDPAFIEDTKDDKLRNDLMLEYLKEELSGEDEEEME